MNERNVWKKAWLLFILPVAWIWASQINIAPDALTQATRGYNTYEGELAYLTDGLYPDNADRPGLFVWPTKGNLIFQFDTPRPVVELRLCVGADAGSYAVIAYREGAEYGDSGQTETAHGAIFIDVYNSDFLANTWVEIPLPPGTETDYIELMTESGAEFYEVEILTAGSLPTPVPELNWGQIKRG